MCLEAPKVDKDLAPIGLHYSYFIVLAASADLWLGLINFRQVFSFPQHSRIQFIILSLTCLRGEAMPLAFHF